MVTQSKKRAGLVSECGSYIAKVGLLFILSLLFLLLGFGAVTAEASTRYISGTVLGEDGRTVNCLVAIGFKGVWGYKGVIELKDGASWWQHEVTDGSLNVFDVEVYSRDPNYGGAAMHRLSFDGRTSVPNLNIKLPYAGYSTAAMHGFVFYNNKRATSPFGDDITRANVHLFQKGSPNPYISYASGHVNKDGYYKHEILYANNIENGNWVGKYEVFVEFRHAKYLPSYHWLGLDGQGVRVYPSGQPFVPNYVPFSPSFTGPEHQFYSYKPTLSSYYSYNATEVGKDNLNINIAGEVGDKNIIGDGNNVVAMTGGDFKGDGKANELAVIKDDASDYNLYMYDVSSGSKGTLQSERHDLFDVPGGNDVVDIAAVDCNGDKKDELAVMKNEDGDYNLYVYAYDPQLYQVTKGYSLVGGDKWQIPGGDNTVAIAGVDNDGDNTDELAVIKQEGSKQKLYIYDVPVGNVSEQFTYDPFSNTYKRIPDRDRILGTWNGVGIVVGNALLKSYDDTVIPAGNNIIAMDGADFNASKIGSNYNVKNDLVVIKKVSDSNLDAYFYQISNINNGSIGKGSKIGSDLWMADTTSSRYTVAVAGLDNWGDIKYEVGLMRAVNVGCGLNVTAIGGEAVPPNWQ